MQIINPALSWQRLYGTAKIKAKAACGSNCVRGEATVRKGGVNNRKLQADTALLAAQLFIQITHKIFEELLR
jgi:hypothetical protein